MANSGLAMAALLEVALNIGLRNSMAWNRRGSSFTSHSTVPGPRFGVRHGNPFRYGGEKPLY